MTKTSYEIGEEIIDKYDHLQRIEITTGMNGYPKGLHRGIIGFCDFAEAEQVAKEFGGEVVEFSRKGGWQLWQSGGRRCEMFGISRINEDRYYIFHNAGEVEEEFNNFLTDMDADDFNIDKMHWMVSTYQELRDAAERMTDEQSLIARRDAIEEYEIVDDKVMQYDEDVWECAIGVELYAQDIDDDEE